MNIVWCFRIECEDGIVPPPALFADGQSTAAVGSYLPCAPNTFSNAAKTAVSQDVNNVAQLPATGQNWTGTGLNWMQQWLDKSIPQYDGSSHIDERSSPVVGGFSEASNLHLSPVDLVNEESCFGDVSEGPAQFPRELYVQQGLEPVSLADLLCVTSCTSDSPPDIITDSQQALQLISTHNPASQPPGRQQKYVICHSLFTINVVLYYRFYSFCRTMLCISAAIAVMRCLSVRPSIRLSVTFVDHVKMNKRIFEIFLPSGSHTILVFPYQMGWRYSDGNPPNGASNAGGV